MTIPAGSLDTDSLATALARASTGYRDVDLERAVSTLVAAYRTGAASSSLLDSPIAALAYALYRMPATHAAVVAALDAGKAVDPSLAPRTHLDVGGGTGAASWAAAQVFPSLTAGSVLDTSRQAIALGRRLAARAAFPVLRTASWNRVDFGRAGRAVALPRADLVTISYVMGELSPVVRRSLTVAAGRCANLVLVVEPGTPAGYRRIIEARSALIAEGFGILAPCPHELDCPWESTGDWCHFAVRLRRSSQHRRIKGAVLGYEDEKFSYLLATTSDVPTRHDRIIRHPQTRKGLVDLTLCTREDHVDHQRVSRREGRDLPRRTTRHLERHLARNVNPRGGRRGNDRRIGRPLASVGGGGPTEAPTYVAPGRFTTGWQRR